MERLKNLIIGILAGIVVFFTIEVLEDRAYEQGYNDALAEEKIYACELFT